MLYGDDKWREMARSILPSRWRGAARAKVQLKRAARRGVSTRLSQLARDPEAWADEAGFDDEAFLSRLVRDRRNADKLAHFERWAKNVTASLPAGSRLSFIRAVLPAGLIGQHAVSHLRGWNEFKHPNEVAVDEARRDRWAATRRRTMDRGEQAELLRELLKVPLGHRAVNLVMRRSQVMLGETGVVVQRLAEPRMLHGSDDVLSFLAELAAPANNGRQRWALELFLAAYKRSHDACSASRELPRTLEIPDQWW